MSRLRIDLQEGFDGDPVVITLNGDELFRDQVTTRTQTGFAGRVEADADEPVDLEIELPDRGVRQAIRLDPAESPFVGISVADGEIKTSFEELGYV